MPTKIIGNAPHQIPRNADLGSLAYQNTDNVTVSKLKVEDGLTGNIDGQIGVSGNVRSSVRPALVIDFEKTQTLDSRISFNRASSGSFISEITQSPAEENLVFNQSPLGWPSASNNTSRYSFALNAAVAPDGTTTATRFIETTGNTHYATHSGYQYTKPGYYTWSAYFKADQRFIVAVNGCADNTNYPTWFDLRTGTIILESTGNTSTISYVGDGWYRCSITRYVTVNVLYEILGCLNYNNVYSAAPWVYSGDGYSGFYAWGFQLEHKQQVSAFTTTSGMPVQKYVQALQFAGENTARFDYDPVLGESKGLLIEESRTNLVKSSQAFAFTKASGSGFAPNWYQLGYSPTNINIQDNVIVAPDGTVTGSLLTVTAAGSEAALASNSYQTISSGTVTTTISVYVKKSTSQFVHLFAQSAGSYNWRYSAKFDLDNQLCVYGTGGVIDVGGGWLRIWTTGTVPNTNYARFSICTADYANLHAIGSVYIWGAQLEVGSFPTSYIKTQDTTFSHRNSLGSYLGKRGFLEYTTAGRTETNSLSGQQTLIEPAATNQYSWTGNFGWYTQGSSVIKNVIQAPDGSVTGCAIVEDGTNNLRHGIYSASSVPNVISVTGGQTYTFSVYLKEGIRKGYQFVAYGTGMTAISTGALKVSSGTPVGGGWYRISWSIVPSGNCAQMAIEIWPANDTPDIYYNGSSGSIALYVWGPQLENTTGGGGLTSFIPSEETFTGRTSSGSFYDSNGYIRYLPAGYPRYTYNPACLLAAPKLLIESAATNFCNTTWSGWGPGGNITATSSSTTAPDGSLTNVILLANTGLVNPVYYQGGVTGTSTTHCFSCYAKPGNQNYFHIRMDLGGAQSCTLTVNLVTLSMTLPGTNYVGGVIPCRDGWVRVWLAHTVSNTVTNAVIGTDLNSSNASVYVWGPQLEEGLTPTSFFSGTRAADTATSVAKSREVDIFTSAQATRAYDDASILGDNFNQWYNAAEGTIFTDTTLIGNGTYATYPLNFLSVDNNLITVGYTSATNNRGLVLGFNGGTYVDLNTPAITKNNKVALAYKHNDYALCANSLTPVTTSAGLPPSNLNIVKFASAAGSIPVTGGLTYKRIAYYPKRLNTSELKAITAA